MNASSFRQALQKPIDHFHEQTRCLRSGGITDLRERPSS